MDKVSHFEIPYDDEQRAHAFYHTAFGWKMTTFPGMAYTMVHTGPTDEKGMTKETGFINGGMLKRQGPVQSPILTIVVLEINAAMEKVKHAGGTIIKDQERIGEMGIAAYAKDTEGNVIGLWQSLR